MITSIDVSLALQPKRNFLAIANVIFSDFVLFTFKMRELAKHSIYGKSWQRQNLFGQRKHKENSHTLSHVTAVCTFSDKLPTNHQKYISNRVIQGKRWYDDQVTSASRGQAEAPAAPSGEPTPGRGGGGAAGERGAAVI